MDNFGREETSDLKNTSAPDCINIAIVLAFLSLGNAELVKIAIPLV